MFFADLNKAKEMVISLNVLIDHIKSEIKTYEELMEICVNNKNYTQAGYYQEKVRSYNNFLELLKIAFKEVEA